MPLISWGVFIFAGGGIDAMEKLTIGEVENVVLLPWGLRIPARIDTGAATSSLDARELKIKDGIAEFKLPPQCGDILVRVPVLGWKEIRSSEAHERRPVVELDVCLGPRRMHIRVNLNDRSRVKYPLILGRNVLKENFVVDCNRLNCLEPSCPEVSPK